MNPRKTSILELSTLILFTATLVVLSFFIDRSNFLPLITLYLLSFGLYLIAASRIDIKSILITAVVARVIVSFAEPFWSDDIYRFLWDGHLLSSGINPFHFKPSELILSEQFANDGFLIQIFPFLNSPDYYSIYPSVCQIIFFITSTVIPNSILGQTLLIKAFILLFELTSIYYLFALIGDIPKGKLLFGLIILNPLLILEFSGNIHFESGMICFLLGAVHYLRNRKLVLASIFLGLSISTKLLPLMLLPLFIFYLKDKRAIIFVLGSIGVSGLLMLPFIGIGNLENFSSSLRLYFQTFEFNGSIYNVMKWIGFEIYGYNAIALNGKILFASSALLILFVSMRQKKNDINQLFSGIYFIFLIYYLLATTVHPWYITPVFVFGILSRKYLALIWTMLIVISYHAYSGENFKEFDHLIILQYLPIYLLLIFESKLKNKFDFLKLSDH